MDALTFLPHGPEFRFLDRVVHLDAGRNGEAEYVVRADEVFLKGHFPGQPIFPGVLLVEAAAQLAGVIAQSDPERAPLRGLKLTAIRNAKILGTARPGETIRVRAEVTGRLGNLVQASVSAFVNGAQVLQADLVLSGEK